MENVKYLETFDSEKKKIRLGSIQDGGYVIVDDIGDYDLYLSCGVANEESFTQDFLNKYKVKESYAFDGTIIDYPRQYHSSINFIRKNIGASETLQTTNLKDFLKNYDNIFIKMDIEGGEFPWIQNLSFDNLKKIKQLVIELHFINDHRMGSTYETKLECLKKLFETHYILHVHGNNNQTHKDGIPHVIELTYVRKDLIDTPFFNKTPFPIKNLDYPNIYNKPDIPLTKYPFVSKNIIDIKINLC